MSKTMKKIGTIFAAATLVGATLTGALAADLKDYASSAAPFIKDGKADVAIVVGAKAATADVLGSIDIASALQAKSVTTTTVSVPGQGRTVAVEGGYTFSESGKELNLADALGSINSKIDDSDMPTLLASGMVSDSDNEDEEYDYDQQIEVNTAGGLSVNFGRPETDVESPIVYFDTDFASAYVFDYVVDFQDALLITHTTGTGNEGTGLNDGETIEMLGNTYTFDATTGSTDDLLLYGSDTTEYLTLNEPKTFTIDGKAYTVEITGGNSDASPAEITLEVNGVTKALSQSDTETIAGLKIFAKDVFVKNIPTLSAAATLFIGSEEIMIPASASDNDCSAGTDYKNVEVDGDRVDGLQVCVVDADAGADKWNDVEQFRFRFDASDLADKVEYLAAGDSVSVPVLGNLVLTFDGASVAVDDTSRESLDFKVNGDEIVLTFTNEDGDVYSEAVMQDSSSAIEEADDWQANYVITAGTDLAEDMIFIGNEGVGTRSGTAKAVSDITSSTVSRIFQVTDIDTTDDEVTFEDLSENGDEIVVKAGNELENTGLYVVEPSAGTYEFRATATITATATDDFIVTKNDMSVQLNSAWTGAANDANVQVVEDVKKDIKDEVADASLRSYSFTAAISAGDVDLGDVTVNASQGAGAVVASQFIADDESNFAYMLSPLGTYAVLETDDENEQLTFWSTDSEVTYNVVLAPVGGAVVASGSGSSVTTTTVNPIAVGSAVLDSSVTLATESKNLIVVGGPCANSVAAALLKTTAANCGAGFTPGKAVVEMFDTPMGKTAMLVAGYESIETQAASRAVARFDSRLTGKSVALTVTNVNDVTISSSQ